MAFLDIRGTSFALSLWRLLTAWAKSTNYMGYTRSPPLPRRLFVRDGSTTADGLSNMGSLSTSIRTISHRYTAKIPERPVHAVSKFPCDALPKRRKRCPKACTTLLQIPSPPPLKFQIPPTSALLQSCPHQTPADSASVRSLPRGCD